MKQKDLSKYLDRFPDTGEWWKSDSKEIFENAYYSLRNRGFEEQETLDFLELLELDFELCETLRSFELRELELAFDFLDLLELDLEL